MAAVINFREMSNFDIHQIIADCNTELAERQIRATKEEWAKVQEAIKNYVNNIGPITCRFWDTDYEIDHTVIMDMRTPGIIDMEGG